MTVLSAAQSAGIRLLGVRPATLFSTTDPFSLELADLAGDVAVDIAESYDWRRLMTLAAIPGDGASIAFDLPAGYDRMPKKEDIHSANWKTANFRKARDLDDWIYIQDTAISGTPGSWIILTGKLQIFPAMPIGETARFYHLTNKIVALSATVDGTKAMFTLDTDCFVLSERLLTLGLIWRWRAQKRMEYAEDLANYEVALQRAIAKDKGSNILTVGAKRVPSGVNIAFPGSIAP